MLLLEENLAENTSPTVQLPDPFRELHVSDLVTIVRHRIWWIAISFIVIGVSTLIVGLRLPNIYKADTIIMVDSQKIPESYVPSTVNSHPEERVASIQEQITSASRLLKLIETMHLYSDLRKRMSDADIVKRMESAITVENVTVGGRQVKAFRIGYKGKNAVEVAQVANQLAAMFIEENMKFREQQSYGTADFLSNELEKTKAALDQKERDLQQIKSRYIGSLPESGQFHLQALENVREQMRQAQDSIGRAQQQKVYLQSATAAAPTVDLDADGYSSYQAQIQKLESQIAELRGRYGPAHPEYRQLQTQLQELRVKQAEEQKRNGPAPATQAKGPVVNPVIQSQLAKLDESISRDQNALSELQKQANFHLSKLEQMPVFEQQMTTQMRDYETLRRYYTGLLDKKLSADTANALESRQKGERFILLDPAQVPDKPFGPKRLMIAVAGLLGGLLGGIGMAIVREASDSSVRNEHELIGIVRQGVIARVPIILSSKQIWRSVLLGAAAIGGAVIGSVVLGVVVSYVASRFY
jgi:polysaccharide chain length determinant protein (PEP-CTERM system associated)